MRTCSRENRAVGGEGVAELGAAAMAAARRRRRGRRKRRTLGFASDDAEKAGGVDVCEPSDVNRTVEGRGCGCGWVEVGRVGPVRRESWVGLREFGPKPFPNFK